MINTTMKVAAILTSALLLVSTTYASSTVDETNVVSEEEFIAEVAFLEESPTCNALGDKCKKDSDCAQGGFGPCNKCGDKKGTQYYKRCYLEPPPTRTTPKPTPSPTPPTCNALGDKCKKDSDCAKGGVGPCNKCGDKKGTQYYKRCYLEPPPTRTTPNPTPSPTPPPGLCGKQCR